MTRKEFFDTYGGEYEFYKSIDDERIYDYYTFYKYAGEYLVGGSYTPLDDPALWE